jgi:hypothetical protein
MPKAGGVLGVVLPIEVGRCDDVSVHKNRRVSVDRKIGAGVKQQNAPLRVGTQSRRENRAG